VLRFLSFYGHPTLSTGFISEWSDWGTSDMDGKAAR
jgi:hypothetical protein